MYCLFCLENKEVNGQVRVYIGAEFKSERFDYYYAEHREALFGIPTFNGIKRIYDVFHETKSQVDNHEISDSEGTEHLSREFKMALELKMLDEKKIFNQ